MSFEKNIVVKVSLLQKCKKEFTTKAAKTHSRAARKSVKKARAARKLKAKRRAEVPAK